jgi:hypothetical protein
MNLAPEYLCSMFNSINENCPYGLRSVTSNNLQVPRPKSEYFKRTFLYSKHISLFKLLMLDGREFHISVPEYRKVLLKYSLFGRGTCK